MNSRKLLIAGTGLLFSFGLWAQSNSSIELPDLTTVVTSEQNDIEVIAVPDFEDVVQTESSSGKIVPELPDVMVQGDSEVVISEEHGNNKQVYAQGEAGGGFPAAFIGNFTVSRITGYEPFRIAFSHDSEAGYKGRNLSDGYSYRNTNISLDKTFQWNKIRLDLGGKYETLGNGLQSKVDNIYSEDQNSLNGYARVNYELPKGFNVGTEIGLGYYTRYADIVNNASGIEPYIAHSSVFDLSPNLYAGWENDSFTADLIGSFWYDGDMRKTLTAGNRYSNRGEIDLKGTWKYEKMKLYGGAGIVFGDKLNGNKVIPPFNLGISTVFPVYYSDRNTSIDLEGGLKSNRNSSEILEKTYKFSAIDVIPSETSNWFGLLNVKFPLKTEFTGEIGFNFEKTAFGNGVWSPVYQSAACVDGLYKFEQVDKTIIATDLALTYRHKIFAGTLRWHANWKDAPALENKQTFFVDLSVQDEKVRWGADCNIGFALDSSDKIPVINFEGFAGLSSEVKLVLSAEDLLKLFDQQPRTYAGQYIKDSGNVKILVRFLF